MMLTKEHDKRKEPQDAVTHAAAANDELYVKRQDGSTWSGERWEREYGPLPFGIEWVPV